MPTSSAHTSDPDFSDNGGREEREECDLIRHVISPPDDDLLRRYFASHAELGPLFNTQLTEEEHHRVVVGLNMNPEWQAAWQDLEKEFGLSVEWPKQQTVSITSRSSPFPLFRTLQKAAPVRYGLAASLLLVVVYGVLWGIGRATLLDTYEWASLERYQSSLETVDRDTTQSGDPGDFASAVDALLNARRSTFGLFPGYDQATVQGSIEHLENALETETDVFRRGLMLYLLTKASLMQNQPLEARRWLNQLTALSFDLQGEFYAEDVAFLQQTLPESP